MSGNFNIDGGQAEKEDHVSTYTPIAEAGTVFLTSKNNLVKSKEKLSDGADEKLLTKEAEPKITTRVDMADAKYVVGDHRNGDPKIELDANKKNFSGLTKEELLKYADDPFWVRLRWFMFVLFWALWLGMLVGAVVIIVQAPKCQPPPARTWYEYGLLADRSSDVADYKSLESELPALSAGGVQALVVNPCKDAYEVLEAPSCLDQFKAFLDKAKKKSIKVVVDLTANFVSTSHKWFLASANRSADFADYFVWGAHSEVDADAGRPKLPNNWKSVLGGSAWTWHETRREYYLHQYAIDQADLNFANSKVVEHFSSVLKKWMEAGAAGVRLHKARQLLVNMSLHVDEPISNNKTTGLDDYGFYLHKQTSDQAGLEGLFAHWSHLVKTAGGDETVFTLGEDGILRPEWFRIRNASALRPPSAASRTLSEGTNVTELVNDLNALLNGSWPMLELKSEDRLASSEVSKFALLLPATLLFDHAVPDETNDTLPSESFAELTQLRLDASLQHGLRAIEVVDSNNATGSGKLIVCARWKAGHTGYVAVFNPSSTSHRADLSRVPSLPDALSVHHLSAEVHRQTNYTSNVAVPTSDVLVPGKSTLILSYVPKTTAEQ